MTIISCKKCENIKKINMLKMNVQTDLNYRKASLLIIELNFNIGMEVLTKEIYRNNVLHLTLYIENVKIAKFQNI